MIFNEEKLEQAIIELFKASGYLNRSGKQIHKEVQEVLLCDDLKQFLLNRYSGDDINMSEIDSIIRNLKSMPASDLYGSNKTILKHIADGFVLKREDRTRKDLFIRLIDYDCIENNGSSLIIGDF